jgi:DNA-binding IclR family transcriptional regulator
MKDASENKPAPQTKIAQIVALLSRDSGATLTELVEATGWQPHTTRAALTGLRKKGYQLEKLKRDDLTCYRIELGA